MILLDEIEPGAEGELIAGRKINRYEGRGSSFRKPMAEIKVGDILWDERSSAHWIVQECSYTEADEDDPRGASLYIRDDPRGRLFYEKEKQYSSMLVLSNPDVLLRYRIEALQREHELLLEAEKPRNAFPIFSTELRVGDTFLHPTKGWLTVESLVQDRKGAASSRSFMLADGTEVSIEQIGRETKVLRRPDEPDARDSWISDEDFDGLLKKAAKSTELARKELTSSSKIATSSRRPLQGDRPITLGGVPGKIARVFFDEIEEGDSIFWPKSGWQTVISLVASEATTVKSREVKVITLGNGLRATATAETMIVEIFVPDSVSKVPRPSRRPGVELSSFQALESGETVLYGSQWRQIKKVHLGGGENVRTLSIVLDSGAKLTEQDFGPSVEVLASSTKRFPAASKSFEGEGSQSSVFVWKSPEAVEDGERVLTVDGWIKVKRLPIKEGSVYHNGNHWDCMGEDMRFHEVREFKTAKSLLRVYAQVRPEDAKLQGAQDGPIYLHDQLPTAAVVEGDEAQAPSGSWLELKSVERVEKRRGGVGRLRQAGFKATFGYSDGTTAFGPLNSFKDSQGRDVYEIRRRLTEDDIRNLQIGYGA